MVICDTFQKREENVPRSYVTLFRNGRKRPMVICDTLQKWEENVSWSYVTLYRNGRKMSHGHM